MKKLSLMWLSVVLFSTLGYAQSEMCLLLKIKIQNDTASDCKLMQQTVKQGHLPEIIDLPEVIAAKHTSHAFYVSEDLGYGPQLVLSYQCGNGQFVSIESQKTICLYGSIPTAIVLSLSNMNATYLAEKGDYWALKPSSILWTFSENE